MRIIFIIILASFLSGCLNEDRIKEVRSYQDIPFDLGFSENDCEIRNESYASCTYRGERESGLSAVMGVLSVKPTKDIQLAASFFEKANKVDKEWIKDLVVNVERDGANPIFSYEFVFDNKEQDFYTKGFGWLEPSGRLVTFELLATTREGLLNKTPAFEKEKQQIKNKQN